MRSIHSGSLPFDSRTFFEDLKSQVLAWLSYEYDAQTADAGRAMLLANEKPEMHEVHALLRRLKLYARSGPLPFLEDGGYLEQPYWLSELLECALRAEQEFFALMELQRAAKP